MKKKKILFQSIRRKLLYLESFFCLITAEFLIRFFSFQIIVNLIDRKVKPNRLNIDEKQREKIRLVAKSVRKASRMIPWNVFCYQKAFAIKLMLNYRDIPSTIYFGINKDNEMNLTAHAWLKVEDFPVIGVRVSPKYNAIACFGDCAIDTGKFINDDFYKKVKLTPAEIKSQSYKEYLGGKEKDWELRGRFQLYFLKKMGMRPDNNLLDIGCGPLRGGLNFIHYLESGKYWGIDHNPSFILTAKYLERVNQLSNKNARFLLLDHFHFKKLKQKFDFIIVFSVLNHCSLELRRKFFKNIHLVMNPHGRLFITHTGLFEFHSKDFYDIKVKNRFANEKDVDKGLNMKDWGWEKDNRVFPIVEFIKK